MSERPQLTYDGHGINGPDEYRTRLATFTACHIRRERDGGTELADRYGPMMAAAPEVIAAARALLDVMETPRSRRASEAWDKLRAAVQRVPQ